MAIGAILGILGGVLGAGGSVAGGALSKPSTPSAIIPPSFNPASDPLTAINTADLLASAGYYLPSVFNQAGPIEAAIQAFRGVPMPGGKKAQTALQVAINALQSGSLAGIEGAGSSEEAVNSILASFGQQGKAGNNALYLLNQIVNNAGYGTVQELFDAERQYKTEVAKQNEQFRNIAGLSAERRGLVEQGLTNLARQPLDLNSLRESELARLNRELDLSQTGALRAASVGGYNPGRVLEGIGRQREDADLTALSRAIAGLGGQAQSIANLQALNPANRTQQLTPGVQQFRQPTITGAPSPQQPVSNPFGASVAQAGNILGSTISGVGQSYSNNQQLLGIINALYKPAAQ